MFLAPFILLICSNKHIILQTKTALIALLCACSTMVIMRDNVPPEAMAPVASQSVIDVTSGAPAKRDSIPPRLFAVVPQDVPVRKYFRFIAQTAAKWDSILPYPINEHILVRFNPALIDTLAATDYYLRKAQGDTVLIQTDVVVLHRGDTLFIPDSTEAARLTARMRQTEIDVNIPEFRLRIVEDGKVLYSFPIRVGQNKVRYLASAGREVDLRTKTGNGSVIRINRDPVFVNPVDGKKFTHTRRDDGILTLMPLIPWTEVELNGMRYGQMIHPTTNPKTLEKPYSNGCIGLNEADAWRFYYHAPIGTRVRFRYDLKVVNAAGDTILLPDIYKKGSGKQKVHVVIAVIP